MSTTSANGRVRKSLAEQIDRLDGILDGLADGLQEAVTQAVREAVGVAVREAVQAALTEVFTNPALLTLLRNVLVPEALPQAEPASTPVAEAAAAPAETQAQVAPTAPRRPVRAWMARRWHGLRATGAGVRGWLGRRWQVVRQFWRPLLVASAVGLGAGVLGYVAAPWVTAGLGYLGGFASALLVQMVVALRRVFTLPALGLSFAGGSPVSTSAGMPPVEGDDAWPVI